MGGTRQFGRVSAAVLLLAVAGSLPVSADDDDACDSLSNTDCCTATISSEKLTENELKVPSEDGAKITVGEVAPLSTTKNFKVVVNVTFKTVVPASGARFGIVMVGTDPTGVSLLFLMRCC